MGVAFAVIAYLGYCFYDVFRDHSGRDLATYPGLPPEAHHIYFHKNFVFHCMVFDIDEAGFHAWVERSGLVDKKGWFPVDGHVHYRIDDDLTITATIDDGILIVNRDDGGGGYTVHYDRKRHRAYYDWSMK